MQHTPKRPDVRRRRRRVEGGRHIDAIHERRATLVRPVAALPSKHVAGGRVKATRPAEPELRAERFVLVRSLLLLPPAFLLLLFPPYLVGRGDTLHRHAGTPSKQAVLQEVPGCAARHVSRHNWSNTPHQPRSHSPRHPRPSTLQLSPVLHLDVVQRSERLMEGERGRGVRGCVGGAAAAPAALSRRGCVPWQHTPSRCLGAWRPST